MKKQKPSLIKNREWYYEFLAMVDMRDILLVNEIWKYTRNDYHCIIEQLYAQRQGWA